MSIINLKGIFMSKVVSKTREKEADQTTSVRLSPICNRQMNELEEFTGENKSRVIVRAIGLLYEKYLGGESHAAHAIDRTRKTKSTTRAKVERD